MTSLNNTRLVVCLCLTTCLVAGGSCKKDKSNKEEQLPPITQTGANTFGCLINGKVYVNKGYTNPSPNFRMIVDPSNNGNLDIKTYSIRNGIEESLGINSFGITNNGNYEVETSQIYPYYKKDVNSNICRYISSSTNFKKGFLKITRYDLTIGIISGEFEFKLYDSTISCDTIRVTQGRFDKKL